MRLYDQLPKGCGGIYKIVNIKTNDFYVGSTNNFKRRFSEHNSCLKFGRDPLVLQRAWNKYGDNCFYFCVLEVISGASEDLLRREQFYIDILCPKYNAYPLATGKIITDDLKRKISEGLHRVFTKDDFSKRATKMVEHNKKSGRYKSSEFRETQRQSSLSLWRNPEYRNKIITNPKKGNFKLSKEQVIEIRRIYKEGDRSCKDLSLLFNVSVSTIKAIVSNRNWKWLK